MKLDDYTLVFEDSFNGDTLDLSKWEYRDTGARRCGFVAPEQVRVENGNLVIAAQYTNGRFGEGWYCGMIRAKQRFLRGYFEIRCICNEHQWPDGAWSAFWLQSRHPYEPEFSRGGPGGAEIDIVEAVCSQDNTSPGAESTIHVKGMKNPPNNGHATEHPDVWRTEIPDCYTAYHIYALEWTEEVYRFFVDGKCIAETAWGDGVSQVDEELIISLEMRDTCDLPLDYLSEFVVDYVRVYQKKDDIQLFPGD